MKLYRTLALAHASILVSGAAAGVQWNVDDTNNNNYNNIDKAPTIGNKNHNGNVDVIRSVGGNKSNINGRPRRHLTNIWTVNGANNNDVNSNDNANNNDIGMWNDINSNSDNSNGDNSNGDNNSNGDSIIHKMERKSAVTNFHIKRADCIKDDPCNTPSITIVIIGDEPSPTAEPTSSSPTTGQPTTAGPTSSTPTTGPTISTEEETDIPTLGPTKGIIIDGEPTRNPITTVPSMIPSNDSPINPNENPFSIPTIAPNSNPECTNNPNWRFFNDLTLDCTFVGQNPQQRCGWPGIISSTSSASASASGNNGDDTIADDGIGNAILASEACPASCDPDCIEDSIPNTENPSSEASFSTPSIAPSSIIRSPSKSPIGTTVITPTPTVQTYMPTDMPATYQPTRELNPETTHPTTSTREPITSEPTRKTTNNPSRDPTPELTPESTPEPTLKPITTFEPTSKPSDAPSNASSTPTSRATGSPTPFDPEVTVTSKPTPDCPRSYYSGKSGGKSGGKNYDAFSGGKSGGKSGVGKNYNAVFHSGGKSGRRGSFDNDDDDNDDGGDTTWSSSGSGDDGSGKSGGRPVVGGGYHYDTYHGGKSGGGGRRSSGGGTGESSGGGADRHDAYNSRFWGDAFDDGRGMPTGSSRSSSTDVVVRKCDASPDGKSGKSGNGGSSAYGKSGKSGSGYGTLSHGKSGKSGHAIHGDAFVGSASGSGYGVSGNGKSGKFGYGRYESDDRSDSNDDTYDPKAIKVWGSATLYHGKSGGGNLGEGDRASYMSMYGDQSASSSSSSGGSGKGGRGYISLAKSGKSGSNKYGNGRSSNINMGKSGKLGVGKGDNSKDDKTGFQWIVSPTSSPTLEILSPRLNDDLAQTEMNTGVNISVLDNDDIPSAATGSMTEPAHGTASIEGRDVVYEPNEDFCGTDQFTYTVTDSTGQYSDTATVTVTVTCIDSTSTGSSTQNQTITVTNSTDAPIANAEPILNDDYAQTEMNVSVSIPIFENDDYVPDDSKGSATEPSNGSLGMDAKNILYTPAAGFCGTDQFTYTVTDSSSLNSDTATVTVDVLCVSSVDPINETIPTNSPASIVEESIPTAAPTVGAINNESGTSALDDNPTRSPTTDIGEVNGTPIIANDDSVKTSQGASVVLDVLGNDTYPNGVVGGFPTDPSNGVLENGSELIYVPDPEFCGTDSFTYSLSNAEFSDTATVTIDVVCDAAHTAAPSANINITLNGKGSTISPTGAPPMREEGPVVVQVEDDFAEGYMNEELSIPILVNDDIPDGAGGAFSKPSNGRIVEPTSDGLIYMPKTGFCGYDTFIYEITFGELSDSGTVTVHILCDDETASPGGGPASVECVVEAEDDAVIVLPGSFVVISPLDNDSCGDSLDELNILSTTEPSYGVIKMSDEQSIIYTPNANLCDESSPDSITDDFVYVVQNLARSANFATVYVDICCSCVSPLNTKPYAFNDEASTPSNMAVNVAVLNNDGDADEGDILVITRVVIDGSNGACTVESGGQSVIYTPDLDFHGNDMCVYEACDLHGDCATAKISVVVVPNTLETAPIDGSSLSCTTIMNDLVLVETLSSDVTITSDADHGTCTITDESMIMFMPDPGFAGYDECTYFTCDTNGACSPGVLTITVLPEALAIEERTTVGSSVSISVKDLFDLDHTQVRIINAPGNGGVLDENLLIYTPRPGFEGSEEIRYSLCTIAEPVRCDESTITIVITGIAETATENISLNIEPSAVNDKLSASQDSVMVVASVLDNDGPNRDGLTVVSILYEAIHGICEINNEGSAILYTPDAGYHGQDNCVYNACNEAGECSSAVLSIKIDPPTAKAVNIGMAESPSSDSDREMGSSFASAQSEENGDSTHNQTVKTSNIAGLSVGAILALAGIVACMRSDSALAGITAYLGKKVEGSEEQESDQSMPTVKPAYSVDSTEAASLTSELSNQATHPIGSSQEIQYTSSSNLSVAAFLSGEVRSPEARKSKIKFFGGSDSTPEMEPISPAGSLFSTATSTSKKSYRVEDVVDL